MSNEAPLKVEPIKDYTFMWYSHYFEDEQTVRLFLKISKSLQIKNLIRKAHRFLKENSGMLAVVLTTKTLRKWGFTIYVWYSKDRFAIVSDDDYHTIVEIVVPKGWWLTKE